MTYKFIIERDEEIIAERDATPDMVIAFLAEMVTNNPSEAIQDEAPPPPRIHKSTVDRPEKGNSPTKTGRKKSSCGKCGKTGPDLDELEGPQEGPLNLGDDVGYFRTSFPFTATAGSG